MMRSSDDEMLVEIWNVSWNVYNMIRTIVSNVWCCIV